MDSSSSDQSCSLCGSPLLTDAVKACCPQCLMAAVFMPSGDRPQQQLVPPSKHVQAAVLLDKTELRSVVRVPLLVVSLLLITLGSGWLLPQTTQKASVDLRQQQEAIWLQVSKTLDTYHHGSPKNQAVIKVVYFHPQDRGPLADYASRLARVLGDVSDFYRSGMLHHHVDKTLTFQTGPDHKTVIHVVRGQHPASHYKHTSGDEIWQEVQAALPAVIDRQRDFVLLLHGLCHQASDGRYVFNSPYYGAGWSNHQHGLCHAADCELLDPELFTATDRNMVFTEHYYKRLEMSVAKFNTWYIGGIAHELGHGLGLPHDAGSPAEALRGTALMGGGNLTYRSNFIGGKEPSYLSFASFLRLAAHPLFTGSDKGRWEEAKLLDCSAKATANADKSMTLSGWLRTSVPACAVIANVLPAEDKTDHGTVSFVAAAAPNGGFTLNVDALPKGSYTLRIEALLANGSSASWRTTFQVDDLGKPGAQELTNRLQVEVVEQMIQTRSEEARRLLTDEAIAKTNSAEVRHRLQLLRTMMEPAPAPLDLAHTQLKQASVSDAVWLKPKSGWGNLGRNRTPNDSPKERGLLILLGNGKVFEKGIFAHASSSINVALAGGWQRFTATVGLRDGAPSEGSGIFIVEADGKECWRSGSLEGSKTETVDIDITGAQTLTLRTEGSQGHNHGCWTTWADPIVSR